MSPQDRGRPPPENEKRRPGQEAADLENGTWNASQYRPASLGRQATLGREYLAALRMTRFADLAPLVAAGVSWETIATAAPALARIRVSKGITFEPDDDGGSAFIVPVRVESPITPETFDAATAVRDGAIIDLVAFHPLHPDRWALRRDAAEWLGAVEPQFIGPPAVRVWRTPLDWLRADCEGIVLLSRDRPGQYRILSGLCRIVAEDAEHAAELRRLLAHPWTSPPVLIANHREARHAA
jgi:hypothetical protein